MSPIQGPEHPGILVEGILDGGFHIPEQYHRGFDLDGIEGMGRPFRSDIHEALADQSSNGLFPIARRIHRMVNHIGEIPVD